MLILEHSNWLKFWSNQSECLKTSVAEFYVENIFIGLGPVQKMFDFSVLEEQNSLPIGSNILGPNPASFSFIFVFLNTHYNFYNK